MLLLSKYWDAPWRWQHDADRCNCRRIWLRDLYDLCAGAASSDIRGGMVLRGFLPFDMGRPHVELAMSPRPRPFPHINHVPRIGARLLPADLPRRPSLVALAGPTVSLPGRSGAFHGLDCSSFRLNCAAGAAFRRTGGDFLQFCAGGPELGGDTGRSYQ